MIAALRLVLGETRVGVREVNEADELIEVVAGDSSVSLPL